MMHALKIEYSLSLSLWIKIRAKANKLCLGLLSRVLVV